MRIELGAPDELVLVLDAAEVSRLLDRKVSNQALAANLPGQAAKLADAAAAELADPRTQEPRTIRSVTVRVVETRTIAAETLMLAGERQIYT
jgi:hypothetical protein